MPRVKKLNVAEEFYVNENRGKMTPDEISKNLGIKVGPINKWLEQNPIPVPKSQFDPKGISEDRGTVVMTGAQSFKDDSAPKSSKQAWYEQNKKDLHIIDPTKPII